MSEQGGSHAVPDAGASAEGPVKGTDTAHVNPETGAGYKERQLVSGDNNADMAVTGNAENNASGAAEGDTQGKPGGEAPGQPTDTDNVQSANGQGGETRTVDNGMGNSDTVDIKDNQETEEVNQFDSVSNAISHPEKKEHVTAREPSFQKGVAPTTPLSQHASPAHQTPQPGAPVPRVKKVKKSIFVSYSPDAGFMERKFVMDTVRELKENNLAEDLWFDKDEDNTGSPCWFSLCMESVEKCRAAILFLSDSYFLCPVSVYEGKTLLERVKNSPNSVAIFPILFSSLEKVDVPREFQAMLTQCIDLTGESSKLSIAEKSSIVIGAIMETLEKYACINVSLSISSPDTEFTGEYKKKKICQWNAADLQEWLFKLGIKEFYRQSLAESMVDGFLLMSLTDNDMISHLGIDSRVVRKKIMQHILLTLDKEHKQSDNWHLRARAQRAKPDVVYLIYDPADVRLAQNMKNDLKKKNLQVIHHDSLKLGRSKEEFLEINGPQMATATHVIVLLSEAAATSPFVFHEVLFADWLGKKLVTAMFKNVWFKLRASLKAVLGDCPAIDFETKMYTESLDVLEHHIKPLRRVPGVVLEQAYLTKMAEGLKPLEALAYSRNGMPETFSADGEPKVFISYQWDMQARVEEIKQVLEGNGLPCWADINMTPQPNRGHSSKSASGRSSATHDTAIDTLQSQIQRNMKAASVVLSCITPKYLQSDNCKKDLTLAEMFNKPIIPVLLRFSPFESAPDQIRKILARWSYIDLSNERLYKQNLALLVEKIKKQTLARS